jgi:glyoxylase-like metal-dependent hydrolase (beta-lactamase superfamily II)
MSHVPAVQLAPGVFRIPTAPADLVNSFAFLDADGQVTLVDCGPWTAPRRLHAALAWMGCGPSDVTRIVLTHAHADHVGGLVRFRGRSGAPVVVHQRDADYIRAGRPPVRDRQSQFGRLLGRLPGNRFAPVEVSEELVDGQQLPVGGGLTVIHTPGHTPGHMSLLHEDSGVLVTGDALFNWRKRITWPALAFCTNQTLTRQTAARLGELDFSIAAFTHGPEIRDRARESVRGFLMAQARGQARSSGRL